jgi:hypothetical protein
VKPPERSRWKSPLLSRRPKFSKSSITLVNTRLPLVSTRQSFHPPTVSGHPRVSENAPNAHRQVAVGDAVGEGA